MIRLLVRLVAVFVLALQLQPLALAAACEAAHIRPVTGCGEQMSHPSAPAVEATIHASPCANAAFCATTPTAVVALGGVVSVAAGESHTVGFGVSTFVPADPRAPVPPPPQA